MPAPSASEVPTSTGATDAGSVRTRAAITQMRTALTAQARLGKRAKSGLRFSRYASRPSCASSLP